VKRYSRWRERPDGHVDRYFPPLPELGCDVEWAELVTPADRRGLTPLFWSHVRPYGEVNLDMDARLNLTAVTVPGPRTPANADDN
jgi:hypothetical protein